MRRVLAALAIGLLALAGAAGTADAQAPRIRRIVLRTDPVFGPDERLDQIPFLPDLTFLFDAANLLHVDTRDRVIRRELLFHEGEPVDLDRIAESERNLRRLPFVREVRIVTEPAPNGEVDVLVRTQDTWTTEPRLSFSKSGGDERRTFGLVEKNLFGFGKRIDLLYRKNLDRTSSLFRYQDPRILGSRWLGEGAYQETSDGRVAQGALHYPFYALATPWAGGASASGRKEKNRIFAHDGTEIAEFRRSQRAGGASIGHLLNHPDDGWVTRLGLFYRYVDDEFSDRADGLEPLLVPPDRTESQLGISLHREELRFVRERHFNVFDRVEDFNVGNVLDADVGYSPRAFGATHDEPIATISDRQGFDWGPGHKTFLFALLTGRWRDGDLRNAVLDLEAISYHRVRLALEHTVVAHAKIDLAHRLDLDTQLFLGNDNGLRGFSTREFVGTRRAVLNLEDRVFFVNDLLHLVSLGGVAFFDTGYAWDRGQRMRVRDLAASAGFGFRVGAPRSAGEAIFRVDVGFPLTGEGADRFVPGIAVSSGQAFTPFVGPFDLQTSSGD